MTTKPFKGKAIYNPSGKAGEYSYWACNFYVGCSVGCEYCYLRKGRGAKILGGNTPKLKSCFKDENDAIKILAKEILKNEEELKKNGLFFSFTTDPMLPETIDLTKRAISHCNFLKIPIKILTKRTDWMNEDFIRNHYIYRDIMAFGFTLTGHDKLEPGASTNQDRIEAMRILHNAGYKTFASIEPVIDFDSSLRMIKQTVYFCDLYKIGFMSGQKYDREETIKFQAAVHQSGCRRIYWKDSIRKLVERANAYPNNCVGRDYNLFKKL